MIDTWAAVFETISIIIWYFLKTQFLTTFFAISKGDVSM